MIGALNWASLTAEDILSSEFTEEYPQRYEDDYLRGDESARDAYIGDVWDWEHASDAN